MNRLWNLLLFAPTLAAVVTAQAQQRPKVSVSFDLAVPRYAREMDPQALQTRASAVIARWLNQKVGFISFEPGSGNEHRLVLHLETDPAAGANMLKETQLRFELADPNASGPPLVWRFRPWDHYTDPVNDVDSFVKDVELRLDDVNRQALVGQMLSKISIANRGSPWRNPLGLIIPSYSRTDLCMDHSSVLRFDMMVPTGGGPIQRDYKGRASGDFAPTGAAPPASLLGKLFSVLDTPQDGLTDLGSALEQPASADKVTLRGVYVMEYQRMQPCGTATSPETVQFGGPPR